MRKEFAIIAAAFIASTLVYGQSAATSGPQTFQFAAAGSAPRTITYSTFGRGAVVTGKPYSATEERRSTQVLGDGTHLETSETNRLFRDELGRTRTERKDGNISIYDPIAGFSAELNPSTKTANRIMFVRSVNYTMSDNADPLPLKRKLETLHQDMLELQNGEKPGEGGRVRTQILTTESDLGAKRLAELKDEVTTLATKDVTINGPMTWTAGLEAGTISPIGVVRGRSGPQAGAGTVAGFSIAEGPTVLRVEPGNDALVESLPSQMVNGVLSTGTRTTEIIPVGKIGNDRVIKIVNERWVSNDLQVLIKSTSSDPRFGDTTYQLSNILLTSPDPSLFQIPGDYTIRK